MAAIGTVSFLAHEIVTTGNPELVSQEVVVPYTVDEAGHSAVLTADVTDVPVISREQVLEHLAWADAQALAEIEGSLWALEQVFLAGHQGAEPFVQEMLSWGATFTLIEGAFRADSRHEMYVRDRFATYVFSDQGVQSAVQSCLESLHRAIEGHESELLVRLHADIPDLDGLKMELNWDPVQVSSQFNSVVKAASDATATALAVGIAREILAEIGTQLTMRAVVASSTLSNGEDRTWGQFGLELGLGWALSEVIDAVYQEVENPVGKLVNQIQTDLRDAENLILNGDDNRVGLRNTLQQVVLLRNQIRNEALLNMLHLSEEVAQ